MSDVNSRDYWDARFRTDWDVNGGGPQSRFFAGVALALMPDWLKACARTGGPDGAPMTLCDIGCAEGAGTEVIAKALGIPTTGVDFAAEGIQLARERHPDVAFQVADMLAAPGSDTALNTRFDIVFSSNTLEHFEKPWATFDTMAASAERFLVLLLPWREGDKLEAEHFVQFTPQAIPVARDGWVLAHASAADVADWPDSRWAGDQVLLVYARPQALAEARVALADMRIDDPERESLQARLSARAASAQASASRAAAWDAAAQAANAKAANAEAAAQAAAARATAAETKANEADARAQAADTRANEADARATTAQASAQEAIARAATADASAQAATERAATADAATQAALARSAELESTLQSSQARVAELDRALAELKSEHHELVVQQPALQYQAAELARVLGSRAWRWTGPFRRLGHALLRRG